MKIIVSKLLSGENIYKTIDEALHNAKDLDEILIKSGLYREQINISKQLRIMGESETLISVDNENMGKGIISINETCRISNLKIKATNGEALQLYNSNDVEISNCEFISTKGHCVTIMNSSNFKLKNCYFKSFEDSIFYSNYFDTGGEITNSKIHSNEGYCIMVTNEGLLNINHSDLITEKKYNIRLCNNSKIILKKCKYKYPVEKNIILDMDTKLLNPNFTILN